MNWFNASKSVSGLQWATIVSGDTVYISGGYDSTTYYTHGGYSSNNYIPATTTIGDPIVVTRGKDKGHNGYVYFTQKGTPTRSYSFAVDGKDIKLTNLIFSIDAADTTQNNESVLYICNTSNVIVDSCKIISNGTAYAVYLSSCESITVTNCDIEVLSNNLKYDQDNLFIGFGRGGHTIKNNIFLNAGHNSKPHIDLLQVGNGGSTSNLQTIIANNFFFYDIIQQGSGASSCIYITQSYGDRYLIYNNIFVSRANPNFTNIDINRINNSVHLSARIFNNTIVTGDNPAVPMSIGDLDTVIIKNNIIVNDSGAVQFLKFKNIKVANIPYKDIDYNHYWSRGKSSNSYIQDSNTCIYWSSWQLLGYDTHSDTNSVSFSNIWGAHISDYKPSVKSNCVNTGIPISLFNCDIEGTLRPQGSGWDKGALELK